MKHQTFVDAKSSFKKARLEPELELGGKYILKSFAGEGGAGEVWRAWDKLGGRFVALKFIKRNAKRVPDETCRMQDSFRVTDRLHHQNICPSYGLDYDKKYGLYLAMKWLNGFSLAELVQYNRDYRTQHGKDSPFPRSAIIPILKQVAAALDYSHKQGVVHRDVKPSNVFIEFQGRKPTGIYLIDFGLASLLQEDGHFGKSGTLPYMPPEQWNGENQNDKTDQYSLGAVAYLLYSGNVPFPAQTIAELKCDVMNEQPRPIEGLPQELNAVLSRSLAKKMNDRYRSCGEFVNELEKAAKNIQYDAAERDALVLPPKFEAEPENTPLHDFRKQTLSERLVRSSSRFMTAAVETITSRRFISTVVIVVAVAAILFLGWQIFKQFMPPELLEKFKIL